MNTKKRKQQSNETLTPKKFKAMMIKKLNPSQVSNTEEIILFKTKSNFISDLENNKKKVVNLANKVSEASCKIIASKENINNNTDFTSLTVPNTYSSLQYPNEQQAILGLKNLTIKSRQIKETHYEE